MREDTPDLPRSSADDLAALEDHVSFLAAPRTLFETRVSSLMA